MEDVPQIMEHNFLWRHIMFSIFKTKNLRYYLFLTLIAIISVGKLVPNVTTNFFATFLWETLLIPLMIITFWDDFFKVFPRSDSKQIKMFPRIIVVLFIYTVFYNFWCFYYIADIPHSLKKEYSYVEGKVSYVSVKKGIRDIQYFEINDRIYYNYASDFIAVNIWENYKITTLKNSKYVFGIEKID